MKIVRSTYRCAAASRRDEARETLRSGETQARGKRKPPTTNARALIPQGVNSVQLRYAKKTPVVNLSEMVKPATCQGRNGTKALDGAGRSDRRERVQKDMSETWETRWSGRQKRQPIQAMHNLERCSSGVGWVHSSREAGQRPWSQGTLLHTSLHQ